MPRRSTSRARFGAALANRRFQSVLVVLAGAPILLTYLWRTLIGPIVSPGSDPVDLFEVYVPTGKLLATGQDPYSQCMSRACWWGITDAWTDYPPVVAWLSQPLWHIDHTVLAVAALVVAQACVAVFVLAMVRALGIRDWRAIAVVALIVCSFPPLIDQIVQRNVEVLLLALSAIWFLAWVGGDRWWGGVALGAGIAIKLVQGPLLVLSVWRRKLRSTIAAVVVFASLWIVGAPQYLPEFVFPIFP